MARPQQPSSRRRSPAKPRRSQQRALVVVFSFAAILLVAVVLVASGAFGRGSPSGSVPVSVPSGPATAAGVEVAEPWANLGRVPLDTPVQHRYTLRNTGAQPVSLGEASIEVLEGC